MLSGVFVNQFLGSLKGVVRCAERCQQTERFVTAFFDAFDDVVRQQIGHIAFFYDCLAVALPICDASTLVKTCVVINRFAHEAIEVVEAEFVWMQIGSRTMACQVPFADQAGSEASLLKGCGDCVFGCGHPDFKTLDGAGDSKPTRITSRQQRGSRRTAGWKRIKPIQLK